MSAEAPEKQPIVTSEQVNAQIEGYIADKSIHQQGALYGTMGRAQNIKGGEVGRYPDGRLGETRILDVEGPVEGKNVTARVVTKTFGDGEPLVKEARTSENGKEYQAWFSEAGVVRKTDDGGEYIHRFKDPAKAEQAGKLITSLASKRARQIVNGSNDNNSERNAA